MTISQPICMYCTRFDPDGAGLTCSAYPGGIPAGIIESAVDHREPYQGDHGLQFEPTSPAAARHAMAIIKSAQAPPASDQGSEAGVLVD